MTPVLTDEYRQLGYETSNDMIRYDTRRLLREYEEAALHIRQAGIGRARMGKMMFDAGQFTQAAEDWLAAAGCFYLVPDLPRLREDVEAVRRIDQAGHIPPQRRDIRAAIQERESEFAKLDQKLNQFWKEYEKVRKTASDQTLLEFLLGQVRALPGLHNLHALIAQVARRLGKFPFAERHLEWAEKFDPGNPNYRALRVALVIASGDPESGVVMGRELLKDHPGMDHLRVLLAKTIAFPPGVDAVTGDWAEAIKLLEPLSRDFTTEKPDLLIPLALSVTLRHGVRDLAEYFRLLRVFDQLASATQSPGVRGTVTLLRQNLPQVFPEPSVNGVDPLVTEDHNTSTKPDFMTLRRVFDQLGPFSTSVAA